MVLLIISVACALMGGCASARDGNKANITPMLGTPIHGLVHKEYGTQTYYQTHALDQVTVD